jgi:hypothetical protein
MAWRGLRGFEACMKKEAFVHKSLKCIDEIELALLIPIANKISTYSHIDRKNRSMDFKSCRDSCTC